MLEWIEVCLEVNRVATHSEMAAQQINSSLSSADIEKVYELIQVLSSAQLRSYGLKCV